MDRSELLRLIEKIRYDMHRDISHKGFSLSDKRIIRKSQVLDTILNRYEIFKDKNQ